MLKQSTKKEVEYIQKEGVIPGGIKVLVNNFGFEYLFVPFERNVGI